MCDEIQVGELVKLKLFPELWSNLMSPHKKKILVSVLDITDRLSILFFTFSGSKTPGGEKLH